MSAEFFLDLIKTHFGSILVFTLVLFAWWRGSFEQLSSLVAKLEDWYDAARQQSDKHQIRHVAKTVYDFVNDKARMLAKSTATDADDKIVDKLATGLEMGMKLLGRMGLADEGAKDELKALFGEFHEAEKKAQLLTGHPRVAPPANGSN